MMRNVPKNIIRHLLLAFCLALGANAAAQSDVAQRPDNWGAVALGLTSLDAQVGWYDLGGSPADVRVMASYLFQRDYMLSADVLWMTNKRSSFYAGGGFGAIGSLAFDSIFLGTHFNIGGDIPFNQDSGIVVDSSLGFYPLVFEDNTEDESGMFFPVFARLSVGYRWTF